MMRGSLSDIYDLAWSPDGRYIISGSIDNTARIWDVKDGEHIELSNNRVLAVCKQSAYVETNAILIA